eukprot:GHUV01036891.1.p1 GENE.GHUV01036891.1~~GHUV01036891.1.p1  ORF type:complete len:208 (-),score=27.96 GHUV01036891.1:361-984(-)
MLQSIPATATVANIQATGMQPVEIASKPWQRRGTMLLGRTTNAMDCLLCRSQGATLEHVAVEGCNGSAINIHTVGATAVPALVILRSVNVSLSTGTQGAALVIRADAHIRMENCYFGDNRATDSVVYAAAGAQLSILNSTVSNNSATGIAFGGSKLLVQHCTFIHNTPIADNKTSAGIGKTHGAAIRIVCSGAGNASTRCMSDAVIR